MKKRAFLCGLFTILMCPLLFAFQDEQKTDSGTGKSSYHVPVVHSGIEVDAYLNEEVWEDAVRIDANIEVSPGENIPAPVKTEVLIVHNETHIFVAFLASDPEPSRIRAHYCDRDQIFDDDWVLILFDTFNDQRRTYDFGCNPFGIQADFIETPTGGGDEWDAIWESEGRITEEGFIVEMAIPFRALNFPNTQGDQVWGFDAVRSYMRSVRHHIGAFPRDRNNNCYMCQSEKLIGFAGASPGRNVEINPTFNAVGSQERTDGASGSFKYKDTKYNPGISAQWGITPNVNLSGTLNPDFSNIEADVLQLDLNNQFALNYPEKRPFFLENIDMFSMPFDAVYTRTIEEPDWGMKVSGRKGGNAVGLFTVQDQITNFLFPGPEGSSSESRDKKSQGTALRYKRDIGTASNVGLIVTDREGSGYHNRMAGIDGDIKFTQKNRLVFQVLGSNTEYPDSLALEFNQPEGGFRGNAYHAKYNYDTKHYEFYVYHREVDRNFRADMGFITQAGYRYNEICGIYKWRRDPGYWYTWLSLAGSLDYRRDKSGTLIHKAATSHLIYEGPLNSHATVYVEFGRDCYQNEEFRMNWAMGCAGLRPVPALFIHNSWCYGDQIDYANIRPGTRLQLNPSIDLNVGLHIKVEAAYIYETLDVDPGRLYTANISRLKLVYQFNERMFLRAILQYKDYSRNKALYIQDVKAETQGMFNQFLFSYKINPRTVFFLGYSDDYYGDQVVDFTQTNRTLFAKLGYAWTL